MGIKSTIIWLATKLPRPVGPWLVGLLTAKRPLRTAGMSNESAAHSEDRIFAVVRECHDLQGEATAVFGAETMREAFGADDLRVLPRLRRALADEQGKEFEMVLGDDGSTIVKRRSEDGGAMPS
jgi:hypothetical protein